MNSSLVHRPAKPSESYRDPLIPGLWPCVSSTDVTSVLRPNVDHYPAESGALDNTPLRTRQKCGPLRPLDFTPAPGVSHGLASGSTGKSVQLSSEQSVRETIAREHTEQRYQPAHHELFLKDSGLNSATTSEMMCLGYLQGKSICCL